MNLDKISIKNIVHLSHETINFITIVEKFERYLDYGKRR